MKKVSVSSTHGPRHQGRSRARVAAEGGVGRGRNHADSTTERRPGRRAEGQVRTRDERLRGGLPRVWVSSRWKICAADSARRKPATSEYRVAKNTLLKLASDGGPVEGLAGALQPGTTARWPSPTVIPVALAKTLVEYAKENEAFELQAAPSSTARCSTRRRSSNLSTLPSLDELRGQAGGAAPGSGHQARAAAQRAGRTARAGSSRPRVPKAASSAAGKASQRGLATASCEAVAQGRNDRLRFQPKAHVRAQGTERPKSTTVRAG